MLLYIHIGARKVAETLILIGIGTKKDCGYFTREQATDHPETLPEQWVMITDLHQ